MNEVVFRSGNTWTEIVQADDFIVGILDKESRYPTATAKLMQWNVINQGAPGWDGWVRLLRRPKTKLAYFPTGLTPLLSEICLKYGYTPYCDDLRERPVVGFPDHVGRDIIDREYQLEAARKAVDIGRGVLDMPPRSGKTRTMVEIVRRLALSTIWVVPTDRIAVQTDLVIKEFLGEHYVTHLVGSKGETEAANMKIVVCTASTAATLSYDFYKTREVLVVDEWHHGASKTYTHVDRETGRGIFPKCDHIYFRLAMTGTNFRSGDDALAMHGLISNVIHKVTSSELLDMGYLVPTRVCYLPMPSHPKIRGVGNMFNTGHGRHGIHQHKARNQLVAHAAFYAHRAGRKPLILVGTKAQGYAIKRMLTPFLPNVGDGCEFSAVEFVSTDVHRPKQNRILESYLADQEVKVLIGTSLLGEGVDLPNVDCLVYARGEKAEVSLTQNAYRVCTAVPGKKDAIIVDFADRHHRKLMEHSHERLDVYHREATFTVDVLAELKDFHPWLSGTTGVEI